MTEMKKFVPPSKYPLKDRISISFSGGKTSAYMTKMLLDYFREFEPQREVIVTFANTGQEHEKTLEFVMNCDLAFNFGVIWLEAVVNPERGKGIRHKIVDFDSAAREGEPFEAYIAKHGIPNQMYNQCTSRLKTEVMDSFRKSIKWGKDHSVAIGIRADEIDRVSLTAMQKHNAFYPCVDAGVTKADVRDWWADQHFNLDIPEHLGNCRFCWKKSKRKLLTIAREHPEFFDFPLRMELQYALAGGIRKDGEERKPRVFFRGNQSAQDILREAAEGNFEPFVDDKFIPFDSDLDVGGSCGESCEVFADLND